MKKVMFFASAIVVSLFLSGCGDSNNISNSEFSELAKQAIKDNKELILFYDFKNRVHYNYSFYNEAELPLDQFLSVLLEKSKDCSKNEKEIKEVINSDKTLTFNCIERLTEQQKKDIKQVDSSIDTENVQRKITIIGKNAKDENLFIEPSKINISSSEYLIAFNKHQLHTIAANNIPKNFEESDIFSQIKNKCNIEQKDIEGSNIGTYDNCIELNSGAFIELNSRVFITGM